MIFQLPNITLAEAKWRACELAPTNSCCVFITRKTGCPAFHQKYAAGGNFA
jgi:hypothetical protein